MTLSSAVLYLWHVTSNIPSAGNWHWGRRRVLCTRSCFREPVYCRCALNKYRLLREAIVPEYCIEPYCIILPSLDYHLRYHSGQQQNHERVFLLKSIKEKGLANTPVMISAWVNAEWMILFLHQPLLHLECWNWLMGLHISLHMRGSSDLNIYFKYWHIIQTCCSKSCIIKTVRWFQVGFSKPHRVKSIVVHHKLCLSVRVITVHELIIF